MDEFGMTPTESSNFDAGWAAHKRGSPRALNPFHGAARSEWANGWEARADAMAAKQRPVAAKDETEPVPMSTADAYRCIPPGDL